MKNSKSAIAFLFILVSLIFLFKIGSCNLEKQNEIKTNNDYYERNHISDEQYKQQIEEFKKTGKEPKSIHNEVTLQEALGTK